jgi:hypothetical protein
MYNLNKNTAFPTRINNDTERIDLRNNGLQSHPRKIKEL